FHLDQASTLVAELDGSAPEELREKTAYALTQAGKRALSREAFRSARKLLLRAVELAPTLDRRYLAGRAAWRLADFPAVLVEMGEAAPLVLRALELADASGSLFSRASALGVRGWLQLVSERPVEAEADFAAARELFAELGNTTREAGMTMMVGRAAFAQGDIL